MPIEILKNLTKLKNIKLNVPDIDINFDSRTALVTLKLLFEKLNSKSEVRVNFMPVYNLGTTVQKKVIRDFFRSLVLEAVNKVLANHADMFEEPIQLTLADIPDSIFNGV